MAPKKAVLQSLSTQTFLTAEAPPVPLEGRENEFKIIINYVVDRIEGRRDDILYISGACGCGKTSTIGRAVAWLKSLPSTQKAFVLAQSSNNNNNNNNNLPSTPITFKSHYINCSGLTREALMEIIVEAVFCDAEFATKLLRYLGEMLSTMGSGCGAVSELSGTATSNSSSFGSSFLKQFPLTKAKPFKGKHKPFFSFVLDEAEFTEPSSYALLAALSSAALEFGRRMSLILISNARSLSFLPLSLSGRRAVTEIVFSGYSVDALKKAVRAHFADKFQRDRALGVGFFSPVLLQAPSISTTEPTSRKRGGAPVDDSTTQQQVPVGPASLDDVLAPSALDYAVKTAVNLHAADLRKAITLCGNALAAALDQKIKDMELKAKKELFALTDVPSETLKKKERAQKRPRASEEVVDGSLEEAPIDSFKSTLSATKSTGLLASRVTLQTMLSTICDLNASLEQVSTFPPYTRQLLKCFVACVRKSGGATYSFMPATLQAELWQTAEELRIPKPSAANVIESLEDLRGMGFVTSSASNTRSQKLYTLAYPLSEIEPRLANVPGFI